MRRVIQWSTPAEGAYLRALIATRVAALRNARQQRDLGASAIELAIITAIIAAAAVFIAYIIKDVVLSKASTIKGL